VGTERRWRYLKLGEYTYQFAEAKLTTFRNSWFPRLKEPISPTVLLLKCLDRCARTASQIPFTSPPRWPPTSIVVRKRAVARAGDNTLHAVAAQLYYIYFVNANTSISIAVWCNLQTLCQEYSGLLCTSFTAGGTYVAPETCRKHDTIRALAYKGMCGRAQPGFDSSL
jgi:hypothetical protein